MIIMSGVTFEADLSAQPTTNLKDLRHYLKTQCQPDDQEALGKVRDINAELNSR